MSNAVSQGPYLHPPSYHYSNSNNSESSGYSGEYAFPDDTNKNSVISNSDMESLGSVTQDNTSGSVTRDNTYDINPEAPPSFVPGKRGKAEDDVSRILGTSFVDNEE